MECVDNALNLNDGGDIRLPLRPNDGGRCVEHGDGSRFVAIAAFFINGPNTRKWSGCVANGLHLLTQGQLIVFELNDQMCVRSGGSFEGFF